MRHGVKPLDDGKPEWDVDNSWIFQRHHRPMTKNGEHCVHETCLGRQKSPCAAPWCPHKENKVT